MIAAVAVSQKKIFPENQERDQRFRQVSQPIANGRVTVQHLRKSESLKLFLNILGFPGGAVVKYPPSNSGVIGNLGSVSALGRSLQEEMATHSSILARIIPWTEELVG